MKQTFYETFNGKNVYFEQNEDMKFEIFRLSVGLLKLTKSLTSIFAITSQIFSKF